MSVDEDRKLFVAGLSESATEDAIRELFSRAGFSVVDLSMPRDRATGRSRGFSFVSLATAEQAAEALRELDGTLVDGRSISVRVFRSERSGPGPNRGPRPGASGGSYGGGASSGGSYGGGSYGGGSYGGGSYGGGGSSSSGSSSGGSSSGSSGGSSSGSYAAAGAHGASSMGSAGGAPRGPGGPRPQQGPRPGPGGPRPGADDSTVYVGNLPFDATSEEVTQLFNQAGFSDVRRVHLPMDPEGRRRGFGFVSLADEETAKRAAETMDGANFRGRSVGVNLARRGGTGGPASSGGPSSIRPSRPARPFASPNPSVPPRGFETESLAPPPPPAFGDPPPRDNDAWKAKKEKKLDKKKKGRLVPERAAPQKERRRNEEFHSSRAKDYIDEWEDD